MPLTAVSGHGSWLVDEHGREWLDAYGGHAVAASGHCHPHVVQAVQRQAATLLFYSTAVPLRVREELADRIAERCPGDLSRVFFCNSGAEANEAAFKFARRWGRQTGTDAKTGIVALRGGFHGRLFASLAATDRPSYRAPFRPLAGGISICERNQAELDAALDGESVAALIVEPVQGEGGVRVIERELIEYIRRMTSERGIALIFDEIQCGLGRLGTFMAYERFGVTPDMVTLAKPLAGGLPMGAVLMTSEIAAAMKPGDHGTTFGGGPLVAAVAEHVVRRLADPVLLARVRENGEWLEGELSAIARRSSKVRGVRGMGLMWGIDVVEPAAAIVERAWSAGLLVITAGDHTLRILPPLVATRDDLERGIHILARLLA